MYDLFVDVDREKHSSDDDSDFRDIQFPQDTTLQQVTTGIQKG